MAVGIFWVVMVVVVSGGFILVGSEWWWMVVGLFWLVVGIFWVVVGGGRVYNSPVKSVQKWNLTYPTIRHGGKW